MERKDGRVLLKEYMGYVTPIYSGNIDSKKLNESVDVKKYLTEAENDKVRGGDALYLVGIVQAGDTINGNGRIYPLEVLEQEVKRFKEEVISNNGGYGESQHPECVIDEDGPEVLTEDGWALIKDLEVGSKIYTYNTYTDFMELQRVESVIEEEYSGYVYHIHNSKIDMTVTPNHKLYLKNRRGEGYFVTAEELYDNFTPHGHSYIPKTARWKGESPDYIEIPSLGKDHYVHNHQYRLPEYDSPLKIRTDLFVKFLGIWLAEGSVSKDTYKISITQNEGEAANKIRGLLKDISEYVPYDVCESKRINEFNNVTIDFYFTEPRLAVYLRELGDMYTKYIPQNIKMLSGDLLRELYEWYWIGDGRDSNGSRNIFSVSKRMMEDFQEVQLKMGRYGNLCERMPEDRYIGNRLIKADNSKPLYILHENKTKGIHLRPGMFNIEKRKYSGVVRCVTVPSGVFYIKTNGKVSITGNSREDIDINCISHRMVDLWFEGKNVMGKIEVLHNRPGEDLRNLVLKDGMKPGISSRAVGSIHEDVNGNTIVENDLNIICWDIVVTPSTPSAFMSQQRGGMRESGKSIKVESGGSKIKKLLTDIARG
jgi:hypothetical protein